MAWRLSSPWASDIVTSDEHVSKVRPLEIVPDPCKSPDEIIATLETRLSERDGMPASDRIEQLRDDELRHRISVHSDVVVLLNETTWLAVLLFWLVLIFDRPGKGSQLDISIHQAELLHPSLSPAERIYMDSHLQSRWHSTAATHRA